MKEEKKQKKNKHWNRVDLVQHVQEEMGKETTKALAESAVGAVLDALKMGIRKASTVQLIGFGTFRVVHRKARMGVNPKTGERLKIKASKSVRFAPGKGLKAGL
ncbi:HU family DNA-binding protein [Methylacidimicrobium tartarophylax]|uniref:DNA-binding protein HU n=1 Tax=Methylacidimicrobium tartarophylax TaxID=1041768 RepID=A0A5E6M4V9_9BACT|nr:HU family DNA-binding protein [Methylacidimicrobium tartarophylax]VVM04391.1 DNA-binding protein HU [Methylacidimicrobium tartarophylax]